MSDQFVAEIRIFPFNFPPTGWAFCDGQLMPISQNTALFSLLGTTYGGDGKSTFALPDMQGNTPMQPGQGQGLSLRDLGEMSGVESITLLQSEIPVHTHTAQSAAIASPQANTDQPGPTAALGRGNYTFQGNSGAVPYYFTGAPDIAMNFQSLGIAGGGLPHNNMQPYLTLNFCIALQGIFPQRP
jgi:microcystin-dependent protein